MCVLCACVKEKEACLCVFTRGSFRFCTASREGGEYIPCFKNVDLLETSTRKLSLRPISNKYPPPLMYVSRKFKRLCTGR